MNKLLAILSGIATLFIGFFIIEKKKNNVLETEAEVNRSEGSISVLKYQEDQNNKIINDQKIAINNIAAPIEKELPANEVVDYWNKKKD